MARKKNKFDYSGNIAAGCTFMAVFSGMVFFNLYLFFVSPPWMEGVKRFISHF